MNNAIEARRLLRSHRYGALGTLSQKFDGYPFGSITPYLVDHDGSLLILISGLAEHTKNIQHDPRVSLITHDQHNPQIQTQGRVTVLGKAKTEVNRAAAGLRYLRHFPESEHLLSMQDFTFYRIHPIAVRYIGGFGRIHWVDIQQYSNTNAQAFALQETKQLTDINAEHTTAVRRLLELKHGTKSAQISVIGVDCDGLSVSDGAQLWRLDFESPCTTQREASAAITALLTA